MLLGEIAAVVAAAFAGAACYISLAEHPARLRLDDRSMLRQWKPSYARGAIMQASLALVAGLFGIAAAWQAGDLRWLVGAVIVLTNWPLTFLAIMPINKQLNAIAEDEADPALRGLMAIWGRLHGVRSILGVMATLAYLWALH